MHNGTLASCLAVVAAAWVGIVGCSSSSDDRDTSGPGGGGASGPGDGGGGGEPAVDLTKGSWASQTLDSGNLHGRPALARIAEGRVVAWLRDPALDFMRTVTVAREANGFAVEEVFPATNAVSLAAVGDGLLAAFDDFGSILVARYDGGWSTPIELDLSGTVTSPLLVATEGGAWLGFDAGGSQAAVIRLDEHGNAVGPLTVVETGSSCKVLSLAADATGVFVAGRCGDRFLKHVGDSVEHVAAVGAEPNVAVATAPGVAHVVGDVAIGDEYGMFRGVLVDGALTESDLLPTNCCIQSPRAAVDPFGRTVAAFRINFSRLLLNWTDGGQWALPLGVELQAEGSPADDTEASDIVFDDQGAPSIAYLRGATTRTLDLRTFVPSP